jgi:WD40 repeat protein
MLHVFYRLCAGLFFVFGCLACTSTPEPAFTPTGTSISVPASTATDLPTPTHTNTPEPTATAIPTSTVTPEPLQIAWSSIGQLAPVQQVTFPSPDLILSLVYSPDGRTLAVSTGEQVHLLAGDPLVELRQLDTGVFTRALAFHPTLPGVLASGDNAGGIRIWDINSGALLQSLQAHPKGVNRVAFQPGGKLLATAGNDAQVWLWNLATGEQVAWFVGGVHAVPDLVFTPDGLSILSADGNNVRQREVSERRLLGTLRATTPVYRLALTPDGQTLVVGSLAGEIQTWDFLAGERLAQIVLPSESAVLSLAISPDGVLIAAGLRNGQLCFMPNTFPTGDLHCLPAHDRPVEALAFHPDGFTLVSGGYDGVLIAWQVDR